MSQIDLSNFDGQVLLIGASGFIGRNLLKVMKKYKFDMKKMVLGLSGSKTYCFPDAVGAQFNIVNITKKDEVKNLFIHYKPTHIIHLAANATPSSNDIDGMYDLNLKGTHYLLEYCQDKTDFIFASSVLVYGNNSSDNVESDKLKPDSLYAITKVASENLINIYYRKGKIRPRVLRLCGNVGNGMTHGKMVQAANSESIKLFGKSPGGYLPLCHVEDTCEAITKALISNKPEVVANICPHDYVSLEEMILAVNPDIKIEWVPDGRSIDMLQCYSERANYLIDWEPKYSSKEALEKFILEKVE